MNEVKMKEIEEIAGIVNNALQSKYEWTDEKSLGVADELVNKLGYHKTVWHKVAEGDLPPANQIIKILLYTKEKLYVTCSYYTTQVNYSNYFFTNPNNYKEEEVIAWTELPIYDEGNE